MTDVERDSLDLRDEDRLPWLEAVDEDDDGGAISPLRLVAYVLAGLAALALVIGGIYWFQNREVVAEGDGELIAAPEGDYKVRPDEPGGMEVEGKGDAAFAASDGASPSGTIDLAAVPETPVTRQAPVPSAPEPAAKAAASASAAIPESGGQLSAEAPTGSSDRFSLAGGGTVIQLGAYDSEAIAREAWKRTASRFGFLSELDETIASATVGGRTYYRLRVDTGSNAQAKNFCGRLRVAGEECLIVAN